MPFSFWDRRSMTHLAGMRRILSAHRAPGCVRLLIGLSLLPLSCAAPPPPPPEPVSAVAPEPAPEPPKAEPKRKKAPAPPKRFVMTPEMDEKLAGPLLALLERDAQIQNLEKKLDEAVQETVRSKAKLASQESRAEAATSLAEAEVALKTLKDSVKGPERRPDYARLAQLVKTSAEELRKENYGGSLYLTNQIKAQMRELQERIEGEQQDKADAATGPRSSASSEFDAKLFRLETLLSQKNAQVQKLQRKLDDTIQETVRTKSKLRSQENKAEAVSGLAEAESALKTLKDSPSGLDKRPEAAQANALMKIGAEELKKENYSGSLYATNQVKAVLKDIQDSAQGRDTMTPVDGEVLFALPLPLKLAASGKVRERPAADAAVAWSVERGASPVAVSYKGAWIRVKDETGRWGWIFYSLIASP
jgi:alpha-D-ribose 1-methylphosphonate 5-triphosphate synthase subunit PhnH